MVLTRSMTAMRGKEWIDQENYRLRQQWERLQRFKRRQLRQRKLYNIFLSKYKLEVEEYNKMQNILSTPQNENEIHPIQPQTNYLSVMFIILLYITILMCI